MTIKNKDSSIQSYPYFLLLNGIYSYVNTFIHIEESIDCGVIITHLVKSVFIFKRLTFLVYPVIVTKVFGLVKLTVIVWDSPGSNTSVFAKSIRFADAFSIPPFVYGGL